MDARPRVWLSALSLAVWLGLASVSVASPTPPQDGARYLDEHVTAARALAAHGQHAAALAEVDRILSLAVTLENPQAAPKTVARTFAAAIGLLADLGQTERAYGLLKATQGFVAQTLEPVGPEATAFGLAVVRVLDSAGEAQAASAEVASTAEVLASARREPGLAGAWYRPTARERAGAARALASIQDLPPADTFALMQIAARSGATFDADALAALAAARDPLQRRSIHEALRLTARRDRIEREQAQAVAELAAQPEAAQRLRYDPAARLAFRDFARRIDEAQRALAADGVTLSGANLAPLKRFQAALAPGEAALAMAPIDGGFAYLCVRRDRIFATTAPADALRVKLDTRLLQAALTATHAPSEALDAQFPVEAAMRLHGVLIAPFSPCLRSGDHLLWLPGVASLGLPLAALLPAAPPKAGSGYDLAAAEWLVRRHTISYPGSASVVLAARSHAAQGGGFDFLGVGDPLVTGETTDGHPRGKALLRGSRGAERFGDLAPLPETRDELEASARGFRTARLLLSGEATERRFRGELLGAYDYLSFATHGLIRDDLQGLSEPALVLTPVSQHDLLDDGLLTASEIADLNLTARFVALSACNTANFDLTQLAQDLPALASAFAVAGTPATLATLWPVNSETGKRVVTQQFGALRAGETPAGGLAQAQRVFLAAPPSKAYLHPRFWAPFVVLGDGGLRAVAPASQDAPALTSVEVLTRTGGEVLGVRRAADGVVARFISDADDRGRHAAGARLDGPKPWRRDATDSGADGVTFDLGGYLVVGGYAATPDGPVAPHLEVLNRASGAPVTAWRDEARGAAFASVFDGVSTGPDRAVVITGEVVRRDGAPAMVRVFEVTLAAPPRLLFETRGGRSVAQATVTLVGADLLVTFTDRTAPFTARPVEPDDEYDGPLCLSEPVTWLELRDGRTGALKASREVRGLQVEAALAREGRILLGGAIAASCGAEWRAQVLALDRRLGTRPVWTDPSVGQSAVWTLAALPYGRTFVAASKQTVVDFRPVRAVSAREVYRVQDMARAHGGMAFVLDPAGKAGPPRMMDSGAGVYVNSADASDPADILLGGSLGGEAAIFHLSASP